MVGPTVGPVHRQRNQKITVSGSSWAGLIYRLVPGIRNFETTPCPFPDKWRSGIQSVFGRQRKVRAELGIGHLAGSGQHRNSSPRVLWTAVWFTEPCARGSLPCIQTRQDDIHKSLLFYMNALKYDFRYMQVCFWNWFHECLTSICLCRKKLLQFNQRLFSEWSLQ